MYVLIVPTALFRNTFQGFNNIHYSLKTLFTLFKKKLKLLHVYRLGGFLSSHF